MTENKQFKIINDCGDYHLLDGDEQLGYDLCSYSMRKTNWNNVVDKLNEQEERIKELETVMRQILYETRANYTKEEYSATVSISPQMHDKLTELITEVK